MRAISWCGSTREVLQTQVSGDDDGKRYEHLPVVDSGVAGIETGVTLVAQCGGPCSDRVSNNEQQQSGCAPRKTHDEHGRALQKCQ